jgi:cholesterol transport system auxiliary component
MIRRHIAALLLAAFAAGCSSLPDKPVREVMYDFGPLAAAATPAAEGGAPLVLGNVNASASLETPALLYRLGYADVHQLRPYAFARWSAPPGELLEQRLREHLGRNRPVLGAATGAALARRGGVLPPVLRVELEEFSQVFDSPASSRGVVRVRCTVLESTPAGDRLVGQRTFTIERPAPAPDAAGGVRALAAASDAAAQEISAWLAQQR